MDLQQLNKELVNNPQSYTGFIPDSTYYLNQRIEKLEERIKKLEKNMNTTQSKYICEVKLEHLENDYDWKEVFGEGGGGNTNKVTEKCNEYSNVSIEPPYIKDVVEVIAAVNGENDSADWVGVFKLKDGRYLVASGGCDYTGWDCQAGNSLIVGETLAEVVTLGLTEDARKRLGFSV